MEYTTHDEINLVRLVRRLEKSVATPDEWNEGNGWIWLKAQKDLQVPFDFIVPTLICLLIGYNARKSNTHANSSRTSSCTTRTRYSRPR